jgi:phage protein D
MANEIQGKYRRSTSFKFSMPTLPSLSVQPRKVDIIQKQFHHDVLIAEYSTTSSRWFETIKTGVPVTFKWKQGSINRTWVGYVSSVSKSQAVQREQVMKINCVGASYPLKQRSSRTFKNKTITEVAEIIAKEFGFNYIGSPHDRRFSQLSIAGHSYWEWLHEQAKRIGYAMSFSGTDLMFMPIDTLLNYSLDDVPVLSMTNPMVPFNSQFYDRTLDHFQVISGEHIEGLEFLRTEKSVGGVNPITGKQLISKSSPKLVGTNTRLNSNDVLFSEQVSEQVIDSSNSAKSMSKGQAEMARLNMPAKVKCQGDPRVKPYSAVYIQGTGKLTDGHWVIKEVTHMFHRIGDYMAEMTILTDGTGTNKGTSFRTSTPSLNGQVNVASIVNRQDKNSSFRPSKVRLEMKTPILKEGNQGYERTPLRWKKGN